MGKTKPQTGSIQEKRLVHTKASAESHGGAYDAALATLFAKSVSRKKHVAAYGADTTLAGSCEAKH